MLIDFGVLKGTDNQLVFFYQGKANQENLNLSYTSRCRLGQEKMKVL